MAETFFSSSRAPAGLEEAVARMRSFVDAHVACKNRKVVMLTSGGTTVPLERNTVRFLDNFSTGTRGATSVEYFLAHGYAVLFVQRRGSVSPFARHLSHVLGCSSSLDTALLSHLVPSAPAGPLQLDVDHQALRVASQRLAEAQREERLLTVGFTSLTEYLFLLRAGAQVLHSAGRRALLVFAAAVSDFYVPDEKMATHKIQSADGGLELALEQVPKMLGLLKSEWAPQCVCVSFKLETDVQILLKKARRAMELYGMDGVVANELATRTELVKLVRPDGSVLELRRPAVDDAPVAPDTAPPICALYGKREVEEPLVAALSALHDQQSLCT